MVMFIAIHGGPFQAGRGWCKAAELGPSRGPDIVRLRSPCIPKAMRRATAAPGTEP